MKDILLLKVFLKNVTNAAYNGFDCYNSIKLSSIMEFKWF